MTTTHPVWFANYGTARVDGAIRPLEWANSVSIVRAQPNRANSAATIRMMYNENGLFIAADVRDEFLWADGSGSGTGTRYDWFDDDALAFYFDPSNTRKRFLPAQGRALSLNLGNPAGPVSGVGRVTRFNYIMGNSDLNGLHVNPYGALSTGMKWRTRLQGTLNNNADIDTGYTTEIFLPWASLGMAGMPVDGTAITMNFSVYFDDTGGTRDTRARDHDEDPNSRFGPRTLDDKIDGVASSFNVSMPGMEGPINFAQLVFTDRRTSDAPTEVRNLAISGVSGYGATINFNAPVASTAALAFRGARRGAAYGYDIRWSDNPITDDMAWDNATVVTNSFVPKMPTRREALRIGGLEPETTYYLAVRALDTAGRLGPIVSTSFTTLSDLQDTSGGGRIIPAPGGGGLVTEGGEPWVIVGSHAVLNNFYVRSLFKGDIYNSNTGNYVNFYQNPGAEGDASGFFDALAASGVNTLRVPLEWIPLDEAGRGDLPRGTYWIEYPAGNYNPDMRDYLWAMMDEAANAGIKLILHPFSTFNYRSYFEVTPFASVNGGPISTIDDFFQSPAVLTMATNRVKTIIDWINASDHPDAVLGIELINEWDDWTWTLNARGEGDPSRTLEMRDRAKFMTRFASAVKAYDPRINVISSSIGLIPRGPTARALFVSDGFDMLAPHFYTASTAEPVYNPDANRSIRPVTDYGALAGYWMTQRRDNRAINNGEWGLVRWQWPGGRTYYTGISPVSDPTRPWTVQNDVDMYRTTAWTQIAMGMGSGLRLGGQEMRDLVPTGLDKDVHGYLPLPLPQGMRDVQGTIASFAHDDRLGFDYARFDSTTLAGRIRFTTGGNRLIGVGSASRDQGMVYVVQDLNRTSGLVTSSTMSVDGFVNGEFFDIEFWSTTSGGDQIQQITGVQVIGGRLIFGLPDFMQDVMVRFRKVA